MSVQGIHQCGHSWSYSWTVWQNGNHMSGIAPKYWLMMLAQTASLMVAWNESEGLSCAKAGL